MPISERQKRQLDETWTPATPEQLEYLISKIVVRYLDLTTNKGTSIKDPRPYIQALEVLAKLQIEIEEDYLGNDSVMINLDEP